MTLDSSVVLVFFNLVLSVVSQELDVAQQELDVVQELDAELELLDVVVATDLNNWLARALAISP